MIHTGTIQYVHPSGLVDVLSHTSSKRFSRIPILNGVIEQKLEIGDLVLFLSDGKKHYVIGTLRWPEEDSDGNVTIRDTNNDLSELPATKSMSVSDSYGRQSRVSVGRGFGAILDAGGIGFVHYGTDGDKVESFRAKTESSPFKLESITRSGEHKTVIRTEIDPPAIERDLIGETDTSLDKGSLLEVAASKDGGYTITQRLDGEAKMIINSDINGNITIEHSQSIEFSEDHPALAKMVHKLVMDAMSNIMSQQLISDFGRPMSFSTDPAFSSSNQASKENLDADYGTTADPDIAFKKVKINGNLS